MLSRFRLSVTEFLYLTLGVLMAWNQHLAATTPLQWDWIFLVAPLFLITAGVLACRGVFRLVDHHWKAGAQMLFILFFGLGINYAAASLWSGPLNPWEKYGVRAHWEQVGAARQLSAEYEINFNGRLVKGSADGKGSYDWVLRIEDY